LLRGGAVCGGGAAGHRISSADLDLEAEHDTDHVIAVYRNRMDGHWGSVAKSNYTGCRYREPVYRSLRELALSYSMCTSICGGSERSELFPGPSHAPFRSSLLDDHGEARLVRGGVLLTIFLIIR